jgi:hypothetical protein
MQKKIRTIYAIFGVATVLVISYSFFHYRALAPGNTISTSGNGSTQLAFQMPTQEQDRMTIPTKNGNVSTKNIYKSLPSSSTQNGVTMRDNSNYHMAFYPTPQPGFVITIMNPSIQKTRDTAEKDFLEILDIPQEDACKLSVSLAVPFTINEAASGIDYGLSFCPNGKPFVK